MFVNDTLETTIRKKRKKGESIVNQTCMQMFNCEYNINIHLHLLFFFMLACYILLVLKITLNEIFQCLAFGYSQSFSTKRSFALTDIKPAFMQFNLARLQVRVISESCLYSTELILVISLPDLHFTVMQEKDKIFPSYQKKCTQYNPLSGNLESFRFPFSYNSRNGHYCFVL